MYGGSAGTAEMINLLNLFPRWVRIAAVMVGGLFALAVGGLELRNLWYQGGVARADYVEKTLNPESVIPGPLERANAVQRRLDAQRRAGQN